MESIPAFPSARRASWVYLLLVGLLVAINLFASLFPGARWFWLLIGEPVMLLIVVLATWGEKRPWCEALRWRWPGFEQAGWGLILGACMYTLAALIQMVVFFAFGENGGVDVRQFASDPYMLASFVFSAVILAPLCEELIFRGYLLGIYERYLGPAGTLCLVSLLFAGMHMQLMGVFGLLPVSFLLTYVAMRGGSLVTCIAIHFAFNLIGSSLGLLALNAASPIGLGLFICCFMVIGPVVGVFALRTFRRSLPQATLPLRLPVSGSWLSRYWPIGVALLVYLTFAGLEVVSLYFPQVLADPMPALRDPGSPLPAHVAYQAQTLVTAVKPAEITCTLVSEGQRLRIDCQRTIPQSLFAPGSTFTWTATWQEDSMQLQSARYIFTTSEAPDWSAEVLSAGADDLAYQLEPVESNPAMPLPHGALMDALWPWHLTGLPFETLDRLGVKTQSVQLSRTGAATLQEVAIRSQGKEQIITPAGQFTTWKVRVGRETAWYDTQSPHLPVQFTWEGATYERSE